MTTKAKARTEGLVVEPMDDGLFIVDEERKSAHHLKRPAACVWTHANGARSIEELTEVLRAELGDEPPPNMVELSLDMLDQAHLLEESMPRSARLDGISRRSLLKAAGITSAALLTSISLPAQAQVTSGEM